MSQPTVYLAGPITGLNYKDATDWRKIATRSLASVGIKALSPLRGQYYLEELPGPIATQYDDFVLSTAKGITHQDRWDATRCDVLLVNLLGATKVSIGTVLEIAWADAARKPIVLAIEEGNPHNHAMIGDICGFIVTTFNDALNTVKAILS